MTKTEGEYRRALEVIRDMTKDLQILETIGRALCEHVFVDYQCEKCGKGESINLSIEGTMGRYGSDLKVAKRKCDHGEIKVTHVCADCGEKIEFA